MNLSNLTYLYVEDDARNRQVMDMILARVIHADQYAIFEDSSDFMQHIQALPYKPDLVLMDVHMQPLSGFEMLDLLRSHPDYADCRVVAVTASVMNEEVLELREAGFDGAIAKPLSAMTFPDLLRQVLDGQPVWYTG